MLIYETEIHALWWKSKHNRVNNRLITYGNGISRIVEVNNAFVQLL